MSWALSKPKTCALEKTEGKRPNVSKYLQSMYLKKDPILGYRKNSEETPEWLERSGECLPPLPGTTEKWKLRRWKKPWETEGAGMTAQRGAKNSRNQDPPPLLGR